MAVSFVTRQINRLSFTFGDSQLKGEKIRIIHELFSKFPEICVEECVTEIIEGYKYPPTPKEIREVLLSWKRSHPEYFPRTIDIEPAPCVHCYGTGYIFIKVSKDSPRTLCLCTCDLGIKILAAKDIGLNDNIPQYEKSFERMGMIKLDFPYKEFKPDDSLLEMKNEKGKILFNKSLVQKMRWWRSFIRDANSYWVSDQIQSDLANNSQN